MPRRSSPLGLLAGLLVLIGCSDPAPGNAAQESPQERPNVVVLLADDLAPGILGFDGNPDIRTPHLDQLASEGARFRRTYVPLAQCGPSRAALLTGRYPHRLGVLTNEDAKLPPRQPTIARALRQAGYRCGFVGKWGLGAEHSPQAGFRDYWRSMARTGRYEDPRLWKDGANVKEEGWLPDVLTDLGIEFIDQAPDKASEQPFFLWISYKTPHGPLTPPPDPELAYDPATLPWPASLDDDLSEKPVAQREGYAHQEFLRRGVEAVHGDRAVYYAMVSALDRSVGRLAAHLETRGLTRSTLLIFTSDNGWMLGEHRMSTKGPAFYEELVRTPLLIRWPGRVAPGTSTDALVSTLDLYPTLLALIGTSDPESDGLSLWPLLDGQGESLRDALFFEYWKKKPGYEPVPMLGLVTPTAKYARYMADGQEEYYDLARDPAERVNLVTSLERRAELDRLRELLDAHARTIETPFW